MNPIPERPVITAPASSAPAASQIPPPSGEFQQWMTRMFSASWRTTLSGYILGLGAMLLSVGNILGVESVWGKRLSIAGSIICVLGGQQLGQHSKDKGVSGVEPRAEQISERR